MPIGECTDGAAFDLERQLVFSSNGRDGTLTVVREIAPEQPRPRPAVVPGSFSVLVVGR
jgi:hypothetical protein